MSLALDTTAAPDRMDRFYRSVRAIARFWLWFVFKSIDVRHPGRVPAGGPVLLCINHPNNFIDSLLVGAALARKVHYLATAALFRNPLGARFLLACGAIPVYRTQDDPDKMERNVATFDACFTALAEGRLIAIYPEGTTHAEARVQRIKTGAARIALGCEARYPARLRVIPVGLNFEARKSFRGRVLVSFGPPVPVTPYLEAYRQDPVKAVDALTTAIQWAMEAEVVHVERIDAARLVRAVEELYRGDLARELQEARGLAPKQIDLTRLSRAIVDAVNWFKARDPARVEALWQRIQSYRALLAEYRVKDEAVRARRERRGPRQKIRRGWEAVAGFPFFVYGASVNFFVYWVPRWVARLMSRKETDYATWRFLASIVAYPLFWGLEIWLVARLAGGVVALAFALSLPLSGVLAYRYWLGAGRLSNRLRFGVLALTREHAARRLVAERQAIIAELERAKNEYLAATKGSSF
ncbi:MAG: 1-acyl-sn-glycerol-3-phosphate acyltransferase [Candidatus Rokubacteria bacterium]|nr:1-acyl-sn-glycerol-3-phosphate acyltransferase [Candidatus Rokubacteria bacterium]